jgi:hypothetical protein
MKTLALVVVALLATACGATLPPAHSSFPSSDLPSTQTNTVSKNTTVKAVAL